MKEKHQRMSYVQALRWRVWALWAQLAVMVAYLVLVTELEALGILLVTDAADLFSRVLPLAAIVYFLVRIFLDKRQLRAQVSRLEQHQEPELRARFLHEKSGGVVMDIVLFGLLLASLITALVSLSAFCTAFFLLLFALLVKLAAYLLFSRLG